MFLDQKGEPALPVVPEVESYVVLGPEGVSLKSPETQGGCPVSLSNSDFSTPGPLLHFLSQMPVGEVWTHAELSGFWRPAFPSLTNRPQGQKKSTLDLLLPVLANQDTEGFRPVIGSGQSLPNHDWLSDHLVPINILVTVLEVVGR